MLALAIRTDNPEAELYIYSENKLLDKEKWKAHRELAETLHAKIRQLLERNNFTIQDLQGLIVFAGPGSFTGLRIGVSVVNALAYSLNISVISSINEDDWIRQGLIELQAGKGQNIALPQYGNTANVSLPRK